MKSRTLALVLATMACGQKQSLPSGGAQAAQGLTVTRDPHTVTVSSGGPIPWKAVVDQAHGGVISAFHLPADGPNLIPSDRDAQGKMLSHFRGLFSAFYMTNNTANPKAKHPRGTLWLEYNTCRVSVLKQSADEVVVEVRGEASGWARIVAAQEKMVDYRQTYTFRRDRIGCDGELTWAYPHGTRFVGMTLESSLAAERVAYPIRGVAADGQRVSLPLTPSGGSFFPAALSHPMGFEVRLMNGYGLELSAREMPAMITNYRGYALERPWQQSDAQVLGWDGMARKPDEEIAPGVPQRYRYEMRLSKLAESQRPPRLTVRSPARDAHHRLGETVQFSAEATDAQGRPLPANQIEWAVYHHYTKLTARHRGDSFSYTLPSTAAQLANGDLAWVAVTARDAAGNSTRNYVPVDIDFKQPQVAPAATFAWARATPESQGLSTARLDALRDYLAARETHGLLIVRNDRIVYEWYAPDYSATRKHGTASMAKGLVGGLATAVALSDGRITLDDLASKYVPQWKNDPRKSKITVRQLGSHASGLDDAEADDERPHDKLVGWQGDFWKQLAVPRDPFSISRDLVPAKFVPGDRNYYSNPGIAMLAYTLTAALKEAPEKDLRTLLRERIMRPIGVTDAEWSVGYDKTYEVEGLLLVAPWGGGAFTPRAAARLARLTMREGNWDGRQLLRADAIRAVVSDAGTPGNAGIGWWTNQEDDTPELPRDAYWAAGAGHQVTLVIPSLNLIVVRNGRLLSATEPYDVARRKHLFAAVMDALEVDRNGTLRGGSKDL